METITSLYSDFVSENIPAFWTDIWNSHFLQEKMKLEISENISQGKSHYWVKHAKTTSQLFINLYTIYELFSQKKLTRDMLFKIFSKCPKNIDITYYIVEIYSSNDNHTGKTNIEKDWNNVINIVGSYNDEIIHSPKFTVENLKEPENGRSLMIDFGNPSYSRCLVIQKNCKLF